MVKPDGAAKGLTDEIVARIERAGLKIASTRRMRLDRGLAEELYSVHRGKDFFERLVEHVLSGEVVVMLVEGERAITQMRELSGATDPTRPRKERFEVTAGRASRRISFTLQIPRKALNGRCEFSLRNLKFSLMNHPSKVKI